MGWLAPGLLPVTITYRAAVAADVVQGAHSTLGEFSGLTPTAFLARSLPTAAVSWKPKVRFVQSRAGHFVYSFVE